MRLRRRGRRPTRAPRRRTTRRGRSSKGWRRRSELPTRPTQLTTAWSQAAGAYQFGRWHLRLSRGCMVHFGSANEDFFSSRFFTAYSRCFRTAPPAPSQPRPTRKRRWRERGSKWRCRPSRRLCLQRLGLSRSPTLSRQATACSSLSSLHSRSFTRAYPSTSSAWPPLLRGCPWGSGFSSFGGVGARNLRRRWLPRIASGSVIRRRSP